MFDRALKLLREPVRWVPWVLAALPALWMASFVRQGSHLQYADYWEMLPRTVTMSGGISFSGLFTFQNDHPVVIPQFLYWLNVHLTGGSNIWLGLFVVVVVAAQVVLISRFIEPDNRREWAAACAIVVASVLLFSRQGVHNFTRSMSGAAWLTANLLVVAAILSRWKDRAWLAGGLGAAASITYATGLVVWPVLIIVGMLRDRRWLPDWRVLAMGVLPMAFYFVRRPEERVVFQPGLSQWLDGALAMGGSIFTESLSLMRVTTGLGALIGVGLVAVAVWKRNDAAVPWIGLFAYGAGCLALITYGRFVLLDGTGFPSRYASLGALFWIGLFGLAGAVLRWRWFVVVPAVVLVLASVRFQGNSVEAERRRWVKQDDLSAALRIGLSDDTAFSNAFGHVETLGLEPFLESIGHYPFNGAYGGDCGLLHTSYDPGSIENASSGQIESVRRTTGREGIRIIAQLPDSLESPVDCVVVGDADNEVVGVGALGIGAPRGLVGLGSDANDPTRLAAMAPFGSSSYRVLLVLDDGALLQLGDTIKESQITGR